LYPHFEKGSATHALSHTCKQCYVKTYKQNTNEQRFVSNTLDKVVVKPQETCSVDHLG